MASIAASAFLGCENLTSITIPDSVTSIGGSAFENCENLKEAVLPDGFVDNGKYVGDEDICLPDGCKVIAYSDYMKQTEQAERIEQLEQENAELKQLLKYIGKMANEQDREKIDFRELGAKTQAKTLKPSAETAVKAERVI